METSTLSQSIKKIYDSGLYFFTTKTLKDIIGEKKESTFFKFIVRLVKDKILLKVEKDKYLLNNLKINDFELANFLQSPSYLSFETALNYHGILSQFPYEITSATPKKTNQKKFQDKIFSYTHIDKSLYWGYRKKDNFLIADAEKAFLDQIYLAAKGLKRISLTEIDTSRLKKNILIQYIRQFPKIKQFTAMLEKLKKLKIL
jgi:predicted transcriptional regulator of viral defense system